MPRRARLLGGSVVIRRPAKYTWPESAGSAPDTRLKTVVLPDPFGPSSPKISCRRTANDRPLTAPTPPNVLRRSAISSSGAPLSVTPRRCRVHHRNAAQVLRPDHLLLAGLPLDDDGRHDPGAVRPEAHRSLHGHHVGRGDCVPDRGGVQRAGPR